MISQGHLKAQTGMPHLDTTRLITHEKVQTRHEEPTVSHNATEPTQQHKADTGLNADTEDTPEAVPFQWALAPPRWHRVLVTQPPGCLTADTDSTAIMASS